MATPYSIPTIIGVADICQYLAQNAMSKRTMYRTPPFDSQLPNKIAVENDSLRYLYDCSNVTGVNPSEYEDLDAVANYVWSLCVYTVQGYYIYASGNGGTIVPIVPDSHLPLPYDFIVNGSTSFITTGVSSITISNFIGYNIEFTRGGITQYTTDTGGGLTYYSWDRNTGLLVLYNGAAQLGEQLRISPIG
jgi:hypothetical protein